MPKNITAAERAANIQRKREAWESHQQAKANRVLEQVQRRIDNPTPKGKRSAKSRKAQAERELAAQ